MARAKFHHEGESFDPDVKEFFIGKWNSLLERFPNVPCLMEGGALAHELRAEILNSDNLFTDATNSWFESRKLLAGLVDQCPQDRHCWDLIAFVSSQLYDSSQQRIPEKQDSKNAKYENSLKNVFDFAKADIKRFEENLLRDLDAQEKIDFEKKTDWELATLGFARTYIAVFGVDDDIEFAKKLDMRLRELQVGEDEHKTKNESFAIVNEAKSGRHEMASERAERLKKDVFNELPASEDKFKIVYNIVCCYSICAQSVEPGTHLQQHYSQRALEIYEMISPDFISDNFEHIQTDEDVLWLREHKLDELNSIHRCASLKELAPTIKK